MFKWWEYVFFTFQWIQLCSLLSYNYWKGFVKISHDDCRFVYCSYSSVPFWFSNIEAILLYTYKFIMLCLSDELNLLSLRNKLLYLKYFILVKSVFCQIINIAPQSFCWLVFVWNTFFYFLLSLWFIYASYKHIGGFCFQTLSDNLRIFGSFTINIITDIFGFNPAILVCVLYFSTWCVLLFLSFIALYWICFITL